jgi:hypothetical protein
MMSRKPETAAAATGRNPRVKAGAIFVTSDLHKLAMKMWQIDF